MYEPKPRDINDARRYADRWEKAHRMDGEGYIYEHRADLPSHFNIFKPGSTREYPDYIVDPESSVCSCPDWETNQDICKHVLFVQIGLRDAQRVLEYEMGEANGETAMGCDPYYKEF